MSQKLAFAYTPEQQIRAHLYSAAVIALGTDEDVRGCCEWVRDVYGAKINPEEAALYRDHRLGIILSSYAPSDDIEHIGSSEEYDSLMIDIRRQDDVTWGSGQAIRL